MSYASSSHSMLTVVGGGAKTAQTDTPARSQCVAVRVQPAGTACSPDKPLMLVVRQAGSSSTDDTVTFDHQMPGKLLLQPDGSMLWELAADEPRPGVCAAAARVAYSAIETTLLTSGIMGGLMGVVVAILELVRAANNNYCLSGHHLMRLIAVTASSTAAGLFAGVIYAPLLATRMLAARFARPALLLGAAAALGGAAARAVSALRWNAAALLRALASDLTEQQLEALERIAARAARSPRFRCAWVKLGGLEQLLHLLSPRAGGTGGLVAAVLEALQALLGDADARDALVAAGGVPVLAHLLAHDDARVASTAAAMLASAVAAPGDGGTAAAAVLAECGGAQLLIASLSRVDSGTARDSAACTLASLAADASSHTQLLGAGAPTALLQLLSEPLPRTAAKEAAVSVLLSLALGSSEQLQLLAGLPGAAPTLEAALAAYGPGWYPCKPDLHQLAGLLARAQAAGDAVIIDRPGSACA